MKISVYTCCNDAIEKEFTLFEGVKQALTFADEVVYVDGSSKDGTLQWMEAFASRDNRIKIYKNLWPIHMLKSATVVQKNLALSKCTGDWCMLMDADEVYSNKLCSSIRDWIREAEEQKRIAVYCQTKHFFGNYTTLCSNDPWCDYRWYEGKIYVVKNNIGIHHGNADGDHDGFVTNEDQTLDVYTLNLGNNVMTRAASVNHYGHVRSDEIYSQKKNAIERRYHPNWQDKDYTLMMFSEYFTGYLGEHPQSMSERTTLPIPLQHKDVLDYYKNWLEKNWDTTKGGTNV